MDDLQQRLDAAIGTHGVVGAVVAYSVGDQVVEAAAGLLNRDTGVEATTGSVFQIGSG